MPGDLSGEVIVGAAQVSANAGQDEPFRIGLATGLEGPQEPGRAPGDPVM